VKGNNREKGKEREIGERGKVSNGEVGEGGLKKKRL